MAAGGRRAEIYRAAARGCATRTPTAIRTRYPDIPRRVSGYNLDSLLPENGFDVARALVGSEGTCVTVLRAELELVAGAQGARALVRARLPRHRRRRPTPCRRSSPHDPLAARGLDQLLSTSSEQAQHAGDALERAARGRRAG